MIHKIVPGILEKDWKAIEQKLALVLPLADTIHVDLIDGTFVKNTTFADPSPFAKYTKKATFELHMMVEDPIKHLDPWAKAGFKRFYGHIEKMPDQVAFVAKAQLLGEAGLALDGPTEVSAITVPFDDVDTLLIYTSEKVGFSGPPFQEKRLEKIKKIRSSSSIPIEVDGGITDVTLTQAYDAGATRFVSTSYLFQKGEAQSQFSTLEKILTTKIG